MKYGFYKSPRILCGVCTDHAHSASADVRQHGEKVVTSKNLTYLGIRVKFTILQTGVEDYTFLYRHVWF